MNNLVERLRMKGFLHPFFLVVSIYLTFSACKRQNNCDELYKYVFTNTEQKNVYYGTYSMGKEAIPCLIDIIDKNKKTVVGFLDPLSSTIHSFTFNNYVGIEAAYIIEFILSQDSIETVSGAGWKNETKPYRIYPYCVIVKTNNKKPILEPLNYEDMKTLKGIYLKWWRFNKDKSIELLRKEWKKKHILDKSPYVWI